MSPKLTTPHPIILRGDGLQVCSLLPKEVGDSKFSILLQVLPKGLVTNLSMQLFRGSK